MDEQKSENYVPLYTRIQQGIITYLDKVRNIQHQDDEQIFGSQGWQYNMSWNIPGISHVWPHKDKLSQLGWKPDYHIYPK